MTRLRIRPGAMPTSRIATLALVVTMLAAGVVFLWPTGRPAGSDTPDGPATPSEDPDAAPPLAEWMRATPDPVVVDPPVMARNREEADVSAGGAILELTANGRTFTLYVPPGAVALDAKVTLTPVTGLPGLPFADQEVHAVRIDNLPGTLRRPATLTIEPPPGSEDRPTNAGTAFAVDSTSRELHLVPSSHIDQTVRGRRQSRYQLLLGGDGVYGIAQASAEERRATYDSTPTTLLSRLDMIVARALDDMPAATAAIDWNDWSPIATAYAQGAADQQHLNEVQLRAVTALREFYKQKLLPGLKELGRGCTEKDREFFEQFNREARGWLKHAELIGFIHVDGKAQPLDPAVNPHQFHEEAARRTHFRALREEFEAKADKVTKGLYAGAKRMFAAVDACCRKQPERWMPAYLAGLQRAAIFRGLDGARAAAGFGDVRACICAVDAVHYGKGWTGSITQTDTYSGEARSATSRFRTTTTSKHRYRVDVALLGGAEDGSALGLATSTGERLFATRRVDTPWACAVDESGSTREITGGRGAAFGPVNISLRNDGSYTINFPRPLAIGLEQHRQHRQREGCQNRFTDDTTDRFDLRTGSVATDYSKTIRGHTEVPTLLEGSLTVSTPDTHLKRDRQATVRWNLQACAAH